MFTILHSFRFIVMIRMEERLKLLCLLPQSVHTLLQTRENIGLNLVRGASHLMLEEDDQVEAGEDDEEQKYVRSEGHGVRARLMTLALELQGGN